uniref:primase homolog protein n=1 Tax=Erigeron canadensis TaxID=72917 RepID=UPI001CB94586|nr:primase homolog protein [Erigeron canadensis]
MALQVWADVGPTQDEVNKLKFSKELSEYTLRLEPLGDEIIKYFAERMISVDTLQKNAVMQMVDDKQENVIAFTYRRKGEVVNCKFRSITSKNYWKTKNGERIFYGLDDIQEGNDIVIVEGEFDKLSMEEAGILNCVSVPDGAPQHVSTKASKKQNTTFKFLSDCNDYLNKAPRIILATDGDGPGQALAEELSRRLGKERCWLVTWPKKDDNSCYKDANEVLVHLGVEKLKQIVETAELYQAKNSL